MLSLRTLFILLLSITSNACIQTRPQSLQGQVYFRVLASGSDSGMTLQRASIIDTQKNWDSIWQMHANGRDLSQPKVNFENDVVIALFMGQKHTSGYTISIDHISQSEVRLSVFVNLIQPSRDSIRTMALTQPYFFALIERSDKQIIFAPSHANKPQPKIMMH